jgi:ABC-type Fe3+-hydroxamate transport system substrate-binding protein
VLQVGKAAGVQERAGEVVAGLRERLTSVQAAVAGLQRPWVFALEWGYPPFNGGHWVPEMLQVAGAEALLTCPGAPSVRVTKEQIAAMAPEVVVFMPCGYGLQAAAEEARRTLLVQPKLASVQAIVAVDASDYLSRPGPGWWTAWISSPRRSTWGGCAHHRRERRATRAKCPTGEALSRFLRRVLGRSPTQLGTVSGARTWSLAEHGP